MNVRDFVNEEHIIEWRRHFHKNPELSFQEEQTSQYIFDVVSGFGVYEMSRPTRTSVLATLDTGKPGPSIALRADMDALPILEETDVEFKSQNDGVMHACGHDAHTAILMGTAEAVAKMKDQLTGRVTFIFQHAEELLPGGARELVAAGVMEGIEHVYGLHVAPGLPTGYVGWRVGATHAAADTFHLTIQGKGSHAATPQASNDPIVMGTELISALHHIVSRNISPFDNVVLTIGEFSSGNAANVIPDTAFIQGTVRTYTDENRKLMEKQVKATVDSIVSMHGGTYDLDYRIGYDAVINQEAEIYDVKEAATAVLGADHLINIPAGMGGEDFSAYLTKAPGAFYYLGVGTDASNGYGYSVHHPKFKIDESALVNGALVHTQLIVDKLVK